MLIVNKHYLNRGFVGLKFTYHGGSINENPRLQPGGSVLTQVWYGCTTPYAVPAAGPAPLMPGLTILAYLLSILSLTNNVNRYKNGLK